MHQACVCVFVCVSQISINQCVFSHSCFVFLLLFYVICLFFPLFFRVSSLYSSIIIIICPRVFLPSVSFCPSQESFLSLTLFSLYLFFLFFFFPFFDLMKAAVSICESYFFRSKFFIASSFRSIHSNDHCVHESAL